MEIAKRHGTTQTVALLALLTGCTVGPNYRAPLAPQAVKSPTFARAPKDGISTAPAPARWWEALGDPELNRLIQAGLSDSPDIRAAQARLLQSRAGLTEQRRNALPKGSAAGAYLHAHIPSSALPIGSIHFYTLGFDATWEADLFGGTRRAIEAASAEASAVEADLADTDVQLAAEIAQAYVDLRDQQQRRALVSRSADV